MRRALCFLGGILLLLSVARAQAPSISATWEPMGIGGGGGIYNPSVSPHDPTLMFVGCDMGGWYRSTDNGNSWRMCDGAQVRKVNFPAVFHPTDPNIIYAGARGGLRRSTDRGVTWQTIAGQWDPADPDMPTALAIDPANPARLVAGFNTWLGQSGSFLVQSNDAGLTWSVHPGWTFRDKGIGKVIFDPRAPVGNAVILVATSAGFYRSQGSEESFVAKNSGLPSTQIRDCVAAWSPGGQSVLLVSVPGTRASGRYVGGLYRSTDLGDSWTQVVNGLDTATSGSLSQYYMLAMSPGNTQVAYVSCTGPNPSDPQRCSTVYRTADSGNSWTRVLYGVPSWPQCNVEPDWMTVEMSWWWGGTAEGFGCNPSDPNDVFFTDAGRGIRTTNGGANWFPISTHKVGADSWNGHGLEVTTCYTYYFDPHDGNRTYVAYTDFGMTRSLDRGNSWIYAARQVPWGNTCYEMALDPDRPGVVFGAWSNAHDLIHWKMINPGVHTITWFDGGVTKSADYAANWAVIGGSTLPQAAATTIVLDPTSPRDSRTLYVGLLNKGVYKSTDDGQTWTAKNVGLGSPQNMNVWRLDRHADGTLLCGISLEYNSGQPVPGALYRSTNGGDSWTLVNTNQPLSYIWGVRMDPRDSKVIYVSCFDVPPPDFQAMGTSVPWPASTGGGVLKSTDAGQTWTKVLAQPYCWDVTFDPRNSDVVYAGTFVGGLFRSADAGHSWAHVDGLPFVCPHRVTVDPTDSRTIHVTTFGGGVWKGTLPVTPDQLPPVVKKVVLNGGQSQRDTITTVAFTFSKVVHVAGASAFRLVNETTGEEVDLTNAVVTGDGTDTITIDLSQVPLADGRYTLTLLAGHITDADGNSLDGDGDGSAGDDYVWTFVRLACDANGDGKVDSADLAVWQRNYDPLGRNQNTAATGDWDHDGDVDSTDLAVWQRCYNPLGQL